MDLNTGSTIAECVLPHVQDMHWSDKDAKTDGHTSYKAGA